MSVLKTLCTLLLLYSVYLPGDSLKLPLPDIEYTLDTSDVEVRISEIEQRQRRSIDDIMEPSRKLDLTFYIQHHNVTLHLVRNDEISQNVPILITNGDGHVEIQNIKADNSGYLYQDYMNNAAFYVNDDGFSSCMFGTFTSDEEEFLMKPSSRNCEGEDNFSMRHFKVTKIKQPIFSDKVADKSVSGVSSEKEKDSAIYQGRELLSTPDYKVELLIVIDFSIYQYWYDISTESDKDAAAKNNIRQFYAFVINAMDVRYKNIQTSAYTISVVFAGIYIADTSGKSSWTENVKDTSITPNGVPATDVLSAFRAWDNAESANLPGHDHAMLFSRYDFYTTDGSGSRSYSNAGLASLSAICTTNSQSITEDHFDFVIMTVAAHELGHSLSANHDGEDGNSCSANDAFIMAPSTGSQTTATASNPWKFSTCSTEYFTNKMASLNSGTNCLSVLSNGFDPTALSQYDGILPGQVYDVDTQCSRIKGTGSTFKRLPYVGNYSSLCFQMWCAHPSPSSTSYSSANAADGTTCGNKQWCISGECVYSDNAPSANDTCLYGQDSGTVITFNKSPATCETFIGTNPQYCATDDWDIKCCTECQKFATGNTACPYGDKPGPFINISGSFFTCEQFIAVNPTYCSTGSWNTTCCEQCPKYYTGMADCPYETNANVVNFNNILMGCEQFIGQNPIYCYNGYNTTCCEQCGKRKTSIPGCPYGDQISGCSVDSCTYQNDECCETCFGSSDLSTTLASTNTKRLTVSTSSFTSTKFAFLISSITSIDTAEKITTSTKDATVTTKEKIVSTAQQSTARRESVNTTFVATVQPSTDTTQPFTTTTRPSTATNHSFTSITQLFASVPQTSSITTQSVSTTARPSNNVVVFTTDTEVAVQSTTTDSNTDCHYGDRKLGCTQADCASQSNECCQTCYVASTTTTTQDTTTTTQLTTTTQPITTTQTTTTQLITNQPTTTTHSTTQTTIINQPTTTTTQPTTTTQLTTTTQRATTTSSLEIESTTQAATTAQTTITNQPTSTTTQPTTTTQLTTTTQPATTTSSPEIATTTQAATTAQTIITNQPTSTTTQTTATTQITTNTQPAATTTTTSSPEIATTTQATTTQLTTTTQPATTTFSTMQTTPTSSQEIATTTQEATTRQTITSPTTTVTQPITTTPSATQTATTMTQPITTTQSMTSQSFTGTFHNVTTIPSKTSTPNDNIENTTATTIDAVVSTVPQSSSSTPTSTTTMKQSTTTAQSTTTQPSTTSQHSFPTTQNSFPTTQHSTTTFKSSAVSTEPSTTATQQSTSSFQPPTTTTPSSTTTTQKSTATTQLSTATTQQSTATTQLSTSTFQHSTGTALPSTITSQPSTTTQQSTTTAQPSTSAFQPSNRTTLQSTVTTQPSTTTKESTSTSQSSTTNTITQSTTAQSLNSTTTSTENTENTTATTIDATVSTVQPSTSTTKPITTTFQPFTTTNQKYTTGTRQFTSNVPSSTTTTHLSTTTSQLSTTQSSISTQPFATATQQFTTKHQPSTSTTQLSTITTQSSTSTTEAYTTNSQQSLNTNKPITKTQPITTTRSSSTIQDVTTATHAATTTLNVPTTRQTITTQPTTNVVTTITQSTKTQGTTIKTQPTETTQNFMTTTQSITTTQGGTTHPTTTTQDTVSTTQPNMTSIPITTIDGVTTTPSSSTTAFTQVYTTTTHPATTKDDATATLPATTQDVTTTHSITTQDVTTTHSITTQDVTTRSPTTTAQFTTLTQGFNTTTSITTTLQNETSQESTTQGETTTQPTITQSISTKQGVSTTSPTTTQDDTSTTQPPTTIQDITTTAAQDTTSNHLTMTTPIISTSELSTLVTPQATVMESTIPETSTTAQQTTTTQQTTTIQQTTTLQTTSTASVPANPLEFRYVCALDIAVTDDLSNTQSLGYRNALRKVEISYTTFWRRRLGPRFLRIIIKRIWRGSLNTEYTVITVNDTDTTGIVNKANEDLILGNDAITYDNQTVNTTRVLIITRNGSNITLTGSEDLCVVFEAQNSCPIDYQCQITGNLTSCVEKQTAVKPPFYTDEKTIILAATLGGLAVVLMAAGVISMCMYCRNSGKAYSDNSSEYSSEMSKSYDNNMFSIGEPLSQMYLNGSISMNNAQLYSRPGSTHAQRWFPDYNEEYHNYSERGRQSSRNNYSIPRAHIY